MGQLMLEVTYGVETTKSIGAEVTTWSLEAMNLIHGAFLEFWFVDCFQFCKYIRWPYSLLIHMLR
jgi:hypothetical protein